jgi:Zn finger protein HypA/HybF involved in hydrogenase expression
MKKREKKHKPYLEKESTVRNEVKGGDELSTDQQLTLLYPELVELKNTLNPKMIIKFDSWLTTLQKKRKVLITETAIRFDLTNVKTRNILRILRDLGILELRYNWKCPDCQHIEPLEEKDLLEFLKQKTTCPKCKSAKEKLPKDIFLYYLKVKEPDCPGTEIEKILNERLK